MKQTGKHGIQYWTYNKDADKTAIFIHGFTGSHAGFQYIIPHLPEFRIIAPDLPGFGESPLDDPAGDLDTIARNINDFVRTLKLPHKPYLVSHSMGGLVAASMLAQNPELYHTKTAFISPVPTRVRTFDSRKIGALLGTLQYTIGLVPRIGERLVKSHTISHALTNVIVTTKDPELKRAIHGHHIDNLSYISSIDLYRRLHRQINSRGVIDEAEKLVDFDVLLVAGTRDNVTPLSEIQKLQRHLDAKLVVIPDVGHLAHYETPEQIATALRDFLR